MLVALRGSGSKNEDKERNIRKWFVEHDLIDSVILLPDNLFYNTTAAGIIIVLRKNKPKDRKGKIVLINASNEFRKGAPKNYLTEEAVRKISDAYLKGQSADGIVKVIANEEAVKNDFNLSPLRYINTVTDEKYRPIPNIITELSSLETQAAKINLELKRALTRLNFDTANNE